MKKLECKTCVSIIHRDDVEYKVLSMMYRPKFDTFQAFIQTVCPQCGVLMGIEFHTMNAFCSKENK